MTWLHPNCWLVILLVLPCTSQSDTFVSDQVNTTPTPQAFSICFDHSCKSVAQLSLSSDQWQDIRKQFQPSANKAERERKQIQAAIAKLEQLIGSMTGTSNDKGANLAGMSAPGSQMDCIDESTNSTTYLTMMQQDGLLKWHQIKDRKTRGFFIFGWPHTTAIIEEVNQSKAWAVDSWFHDNGIAPEIVPLAQWKSGWEPEKP